MLTFPICNKALSLVLTGSSHEVTLFNKSLFAEPKTELVLYIQGDKILILFFEKNEGF